ncbi:hypothetical protein VTO73DRAFT_7561 [Trametes versicolor]
MSNSSTKKVVLPLDILLYILDCVDGDDPSSLYNCALAGHALLPHTRICLYRSITLMGQGRAIANARTLSCTLTDHPALGSLVRSLTISRFTASDADEIDDAVISPRVLPWNLFISLRTLSLEWVQLMNTESLVVVISMLPRLERLVCYMVWDELRSSRLRLDPPSDHPLDSDGMQFIPDPSQFPTIREIVVKLGGWSHSVLVDRLLQDGGRSLLGLQMINVSFEGAAQVLPWISVIHAARTSLSAISVSTGDRAHALTETVPQWAVARADQHPSYHAYTLNTIAQCPALRFLHLRFRPDTFLQDPPSEGFFELLCALFERRPPPFPVFEHLKLKMVDRAGRLMSITDELCARLAGSLLDRQRYSAFRRLTLRVEPQVWNDHHELWSSRFAAFQLDELRDALVTRWRAAFAAFDRAPGVVLDVDVYRIPTFADSGSITTAN